MKAYYHKSSSILKYCKPWDGWFIQWHNDDEPYIYGALIAARCGYNTYDNFVNDIIKFFGGYDTVNRSVCLPSKEKAEEAIEWVESMILMKKLEKDMSR